MCPNFGRVVHAHPCVNHMFVVLSLWAWLTFGPYLFQPCLCEAHIRPNHGCFWTAWFLSAGTHLLIRMKEAERRTSRTCSFSPVGVYHQNRVPVPAGQTQNQQPNTHKHTGWKQNQLGSFVKYLNISQIIGFSSCQNRCVCLYARVCRWWIYIFF